MKLELGFGSGTQAVDIPDENLLEVLTPNKMTFTSTGEDEVRRALNDPIGTKRLRDIVRPHEKIAIITSDVTRPMPTYKVMPALIRELDAAGVADADVVIVFGLGSHRRQTEDEMKRLVGEETCASASPKTARPLKSRARSRPPRAASALATSSTTTSRATPAAARR